MIEIVRVTPALLAGLAELERLTFTHPWSAQALELLCGESAFGFAALCDGAVVAYGGMLTVLDEGQITNVATHQDHRRKGLAGQVVAALLTEARARGIAFVTLEVRESNATAIHLYEKFGFATVGRRPRFYTGPTEAALLMRCDLVDA